MPAGIKIYKIKDFIRKNESGELSYNRIREIIRELATAAAIHPDHNILIDFRETTLSDFSMIDILREAMEMDRFKDVLKNKIATLVPKDKNRVSFSQKMEAAIQIKGLQYKFFTDFEDAIEWLSDIKI